MYYLMGNAEDQVRINDLFSEKTEAEKIFEKIKGFPAKRIDFFGVPITILTYEWWPKDIIAFSNFDGSGEITYIRLKGKNGEVGSTDF